MKTPPASALRLLTLAIAATAVVFTAFDAAPAAAQTAARVEAQTRPNFGLLLSPSAGSRSSRNHRRYDYRTYRPDWRPDWRPGPDGGWGPGYGPGTGPNEVVVTCGGNPGSGAIESAVRRVPAGGTLTIRSNGGACVGWLNIDKPMTVRGSGTYAGQVTLQAPEGLPCITVAPGVRAVIQDLAMAAPSAGDAPCVAGDEATVVLDRVSLRYVGNESPFLIRGGQLDIRNASIDAKTMSPAILVEDGTLTAVSVNVLNAQSGIEVAPGSGGPSLISSVYLTGEHNPSNFGPRSIGVNVRSRREIGELNIVNSRICGYNEGVAVDGTRVSVQGSKICLADKGLVVYGGEAKLDDSRVRARYVGVYADAGRAVVTSSIFSGVDQPFYAGPRGDIDANRNRLWSRSDICAPDFRDEYRGRYSPDWNGRRRDDRFTCMTRPYPQQWWAEEEGALGLPYVNDAYTLPGLARFNAGCGWYSREGGFIDDPRYFGEVRWGRRNPPLPYAADPRYDRGWIRQQERLREDSCRFAASPGGPILGPTPRLDGPGPGY
ncbi:MAG: hypothetical protein EBR82_01345 [Caulobacteraceae bacterium]|nr:hypothetical protein [Caulobacteraceae bacterium]